MSTSILMEKNISRRDETESLGTLTKRKRKRKLFFKRHIENLASKISQNLAFVGRISCLRDDERKELVCRAEIRFRLEHFCLTWEKVFNGQQKRARTNIEHRTLSLYISLENPQHRRDVVNIRPLSVSRCPPLPPTAIEAVTKTSYAMSS